MGTVVPCTLHSAEQHNMKSSNISITERKKSLEASTVALAEKTGKVGYSTNFSIKPLIKFFNKRFKKETLMDPRKTNSNTNEFSKAITKDKEDFKEETCEVEECFSDSSSNCESLDLSFGDISFSSCTDGDLFN